MNQPLLSLQSIACERAYRQLFIHLNLELYSGEVVRIHGPNGAGKSTLLKIITGISSDYEGDILFEGHPLADVVDSFRQAIFYLGHAKAIKKSLTAEENLIFFSSMYPCKSGVTIKQALQKVGLAGYEDTLCQAMSAGQQQRVALARLVLSAAQIWILDEPFTAIDVEGVALFESLISEFTHQGGAVLITTHHQLRLDCPFRVLNLEEFVA